MVKKKFDESEKMSFRCSKVMAGHLKSIAMSFTRQEGKLYTVSELIRDTLHQMFPEPKQLDLIDELDKNKRTTSSRKAQSDGAKSISQGDFLDRGEE